MKLQTIIRILRDAKGIKSTIASREKLRRPASYLSKVETSKMRLYRDDLEPVILMLDQEHNTDYLTYKWHEHQPSIRVPLDDPRTPKSLRILASMYDAGIYPKDHDLEKIVEGHEPSLPADIQSHISESLGITGESPQPPPAQSEAT